ncbi:MAG: hypothetical protein MJE68_01110 [Proteobacteria bacterium]|nr:hypothetical protein [Pseudomonadota bacterium]
MKLNQQLILQSNDCGCVIYECTVSGNGAITWSGSAFECESSMNEIILLSADQNYSACNDGAIKARRINYTSQLIITNRSLSGSNINCIQDNGTNSIIVIGNLSLSNISESSGRCSCQGDRHINNNCTIYSNCRIAYSSTAL